MAGCELCAADCGETIIGKQRASLPLITSPHVPRSASGPDSSYSDMEKLTKWMKIIASDSQSLTHNLIYFFKNVHHGFLCDRQGLFKLNFISSVRWSLVRSADEVWFSPVCMFLCACLRYDDDEVQVKLLQNQEEVQMPSN